MGEFGDLRFPYPLDRPAPQLQPDPAFQRLAAVVKRSHGAAASAVPQPRVVIARRQRTRILANAGELQVRLAAAGLNAAIVDFAAMSFKDQVIAASLTASASSVAAQRCCLFCYSTRLRLSLWQSAFAGANCKWRSGADLSARR